MASYMDHIRKMSDADFAYFLNFLQIEIPLLALAVDRTEQKKRAPWREGDHGTVDLNMDARHLYFTLCKDYDEEMNDLENEINRNAT